MALYPENIQKIVCDSIYFADKAIRSELADGYIANENDYTSNFTGMIRRNINARNNINLSVVSKVLNGSYERRYGADACIILANKLFFKVCFIEAKWARHKTNVDSWDSIQKSSGRSHFLEQIERQSIICNRVAIWEMFYSEYAFNEQPTGYPNLGSACVWHHDAMAFSNERANPSTRWSDADLFSLLSICASGIYDFIAAVCECRRGELFSGNNYEKVLGELDSMDFREVTLIQYSGSLDDDID